MSSSCEKDRCCSSSLKVSGCSRIPQAAWISPVSPLHISMITVLSALRWVVQMGKGALGLMLCLQTGKPSQNSEWWRVGCWLVLACAIVFISSDWSLTTGGLASSGATWFECTVFLFCILVGKLEIECSSGLEVGSCYCGISYAQVQQDQGWPRTRKLVLSTVCFLRKMLKTLSWHLWI